MHTARWWAVMGVGMLLGCRTTAAPETNPDLPPLKEPAANVFCPAGEIGQRPPPRTPDMLSEEDVANFMEPRMGFLRECYEDRVRQGYAIEGHVGFRFRVSPEGHVQQICLVEDATHDADLISCLFGELGTWQFPKKLGTTEVRHRVTFRLPRR